MATIDVDLWDMDAFQRQEHHAMLEQLRETDPGIHFLDEGEMGPGFWAITRLEHLREINRQPEIFSSNERGTQMYDGRGGDDSGMMDNDSLMLMMDPPKHTRYRRIVSRGFTPRMIDLLEDYLLNRTAMIIDQVCENGSADFVTELAAELPLQAIAEMVGIPLEDRSKIFKWSNQMIGSEDPDFTTVEDDVMTAAAELFMYSRALQEDRRDKPADDIITTLLSADVDGEKLDETEFDMFFLLLCVAGNETTRNAITRGRQAFFDFPDQWEKFRADPDRYMDTAVDEIVRWATPVLNFRRQAMQDYEIGGVQIKKGDKVIVLSGKDKGKTGEVTKSLPKEGKVVVSGVNVATRHRKPTQQNPQGGIDRFEAPMSISKVALADPKDGKPTRVRFEEKDGKKVRVAVKSGETIDG